MLWCLTSFCTLSIFLMGLREVAVARLLGVRVTLRTTLEMRSRPGLDFDLGGRVGLVLGERWRLLYDLPMGGCCCLLLGLLYLPSGLPSRSGLVLHPE
jgi:hypothetical protein